MRLNFRKAILADQETIFTWLKEDHVIEFWDNTQEHKDDIIIFLNGRKEKSNYVEGRYTYWLACDSSTPFAPTSIVTANLFLRYP